MLNPNDSDTARKKSSDPYVPMSVFGRIFALPLLLFLFVAGGNGCARRPRESGRRPDRSIARASVPVPQVQTMQVLGFLKRTVWRDSD
jgi:hypothetical protein